MITKPSVRYVCPPDCGRPPTGTPVEINPRFTAADGSFSVSYPRRGRGIQDHHQAQRDHRRICSPATAARCSCSVSPPRNRSPEQIAKDLVKQTFPDTRTAYEIPNAMVGYQPGYGEAADCWPQGANSSYMKMRVLVMVAVKNDLALVAAAVGPFHAFGPDFGSGKPSGANLQIALDMGKYVNSFSWRGDPPR